MIGSSSTGMKVDVRDSEADVAGTAAVNEPVRASSGIDANLHPAFDKSDVVAVMVAGSDLGGELFDGSVDDGEVICDGVRAGVARA